MTICGECDAHYESHEIYAGEPLHTGYCNKMMQNVNKWDRCLYEPSEEVLSRAEEACEKLESKDESVDRHYWQAVAGDQLPQLLAEVERLRAALAHELDLRNRHIESLEARIKELEAEVEARNKQIKELQDIIDKPPEEADWVANYHLSTYQNASGNA